MKSDVALMLLVFAVVKSDMKSDRAASSALAYTAIFETPVS